MPRGWKVSPELVVVMLRQIEVQVAQGKSLAPAQLKRPESPSRTSRRVPQAVDVL